MTDAVFATLRHPAGDNRRQRSGSRSRERRKRRNVEHIHLSISFMGLARSRRLQLLASAGHRAGALLKNRLAGIAQIRFALPQAVLDPSRVGDVAAAES